MSRTLARVLSDLDIAVFERSDTGAFTLISAPPAWLLAFAPSAAQQEHFELEADFFLFLEDFLERHASFWASPSGEQLTSGIWTEALPDGQEQLLQATALFIDQRPYLLIRVPPHQETWPIYQHAREQRLENEQLIEEINKREVLLHCIVHDLSNPLAGIKGSLDVLLAEELLDSDGNELVQIGVRQAQKMQQLIRSILSTFANEVKPLVPTLIGEEIAPSMQTCVEDVIRGLSATATLKGISLDTSFSGASESLKVAGELERLERVLFNLLANAIRHTPSGGNVAVTVEHDGDTVTTYVEDSGSGVPQNLEPHLFNRFSQGAEHTGLAGLGLYFCRITIENWGGAIGYRQSDSGGACFWFRLPKPLKHPEHVISRIPAET